MAKMKWFNWVVVALVVIGALNWGILGLSSLFGVGALNIVSSILGKFPMILNLVYSLVGVAGVITLVKFIK